MDNKALVQLALHILSCSQKELAICLGVSPTQISKWKKGEHMSWEMEKKIQTILDIGDRAPSFILWAGSLENAIKWERLIHYLASLALESAETGYNTYPLEDEMGLLCLHTSAVLVAMGVAAPEEFPKELDIDYGEDEDNEELWHLIKENQYSDLIYKIFNSLNNVYGFYAAYVRDLIDDDYLNLIDTPAINIEPELISLAACKVETSSSFATRIMHFRYETRKNFEEWLSIVKDKAFRAGIPLRAELMNMIHDSGGELGHEAEAESLGFNASRLHPDIYMNELLVGMRAINKVLPAIMRKLGIDEDFELDDSELRIK